MTAKFQHALIVGGSGMLGGLCRRLLACSNAVSVMARDEARIRTLSPKLIPVVCDYNDETATAMALGVFVAAYGAPDIIVAWIHGRAPKQRRLLASQVKRNGRFVQVLGSATADPAHPQRLEEMKSVATGLPLRYQAVVLGFQIESGRSRWLTDDEISDGVFAAMESDAPLSIVGTAEPWSARP